MPKVTEIVSSIKPYVQRWIDEGGGGGGEGAPSPHALNSIHHTGELADSQATQFLKIDGTRTLVGNLPVGAGITVDGVDISVFYDDFITHANNPNAHHYRLHYMLSPQDHSVSGAKWSLIGLNATDTLALLIPSSQPGPQAAILRTDDTGILGLNQLRTDKISHLNTADVDIAPAGTLYLDPGAQAVLPKYHAVIALGSATRTWEVLHSNSVITPYVTTAPVATDLTLAPTGDLILDPTGNDVLPHVDNDVRIGSMTKRLQDVHTVDVYASYVKTATGDLYLLPYATGVLPAADNHLTLGNASLGYASLYAYLLTTGAGNLAIAPAGDVILNPTGNDVLPQQAYDINLGTLSKKYLTLHAAELWVETLVAQDTMATIGGRVLVGPTTQLEEDLPAAGWNAILNGGFEEAG